MNQIVEQFSNIWKGTSFGQRLIFVVVILGFMVGLLAVTFWVRTPEYGLLYGDMDQKDASEVVTYLRDNNIVYKIIDNGSTILVPSNKIYEIRMALANADLPRGDVGFELFDKNQFGISDLAQRVNYRRALQGELSKTITQLDGIRQAKVQIVIPEPSLFDKKPSTASVILWANKRDALDALKIAGITHLISTSVEGLTPENITITDNMGNLLSRTGDSKVSRIITNQFDLNRNIEDYYTSKAMSILEKMAGPGRAKVKVSVDLDFNHVDERHIEYDQDKRVPKNQVVTTQSMELPHGADNGDSDSVGRFTKEKKETETTVYELSRVERNISEHRARIRRLTVAILVDGKYEKVKDEDGVIYTKYIPRTDEELNRIAAVIKQAIGFDESPPRNDKLEIQNIEFQRDFLSLVDEEGFEETDKRKFILSIAKSASFGIAVLAFLWFAAVALRRILVTTGGYATYPALPELQSSQTDKTEEAMLNKSYVKHEEIRDSIIESIKSNPKTTSNLVREWLKGE